MSDQSLRWPPSLQFTEMAKVTRTEERMMMMMMMMATIRSHEVQSFGGKPRALHSPSLTNHSLNSCLLLVVVASASPFGSFIVIPLRKSVDLPCVTTAHNRDTSTSGIVSLMSFIKLDL